MPYILSHYALYQLYLTPWLLFACFFSLFYLIGQDFCEPLYIRTDLERLKAYWLEEKAHKSRLGYETAHDGVTLGLLSQPQQGQWQPFTCLNSMRNVEPSVHLILDDRPLSKAEEQEDEDESGEAEEVAE